MTVQGFLILIAIAGFAGLAGSCIKRFAMPGYRSLALLVTAGLPLVAYFVWGFADGCLTAPAGNAQRCFGWGFGLAILVPFGMPPWVFGLLVGSSITQPVRSA